MKSRILIISAACFLALAVSSVSLLSRSAEPTENIDESCTPSKTQVEVPPDSSKSRNIKLALILDTSNSMDGLIDQAKTQLWKFVNELSQTKADGETPVLQIALYEYGNDRLSSRSGFVKLVSPFTGDLDEISSKLFSLTTNGGNEYCGEVIQQSVSSLNWTGNDNDLRIIFIAGNEPFNQGNYSYRSACEKAVAEGINVNTIFCGDYEEGIRTFWQSGALAGRGNYMCINQDLRTVFYDTPYDRVLDSLNTELNGTYLYYGKEAGFRKENQLIQDRNSQLYGSANKAERSVSKAGSFYSNSNWDLVDAYNDKSTDLSRIPDKEWPAELKALAMEQRIRRIQEMDAKRTTIKNEILDVNKLRLQYIDKQKVESGNVSSLDASMLKAIREQAVMKGFEFKNSASHSE